MDRQSHVMKPSEVIPADSFRHSYDAANVKHKPRCVKTASEPSKQQSSQLQNTIIPVMLFASCANDWNSVSCDQQNGQREASSNVPRSTVNTEVNEEGAALRNPFSRLLCNVNTQGVKKPYDCEGCQRTFSDYTKLQLHKLIHRDASSDARRNTMNTRVREEDVPLSRPLHSADIQNFKKLQECNEHRKTSGASAKLHLHNCDLQPFVCDICNNSYSRFAELNRHRRIHADTKSHTCDICNKSFTIPSYLTKHKRTHQGNKPYTCFLCRKEFTQLTHLATHQLTHSGIKPYVCDVCGSTFSQSGHLNSHRRLHTGERPYVCDICNKPFNDSSHLSRHKRIHSGDKRYTCGLCHRAFTDSTSLTVHRRSHTGEKPYVCDVCEKAFGDSSSLTKHKRIHTREKPYACNVCGQTFTVSTSLNKHRHVHTIDRLHNCNLCCKSFSTFSSLSRHRLNKHH